MLDIEVIAQPAQAEDRPPVEGFTGWWDASNAGSIQGGLGDRVATWRDGSGYGRHLNSPTDATRPQTGSWNQNGRNVLWTHGRTAWMQGPIAWTAQPWVMCLVGSNTETDASQRTFVAGYDGITGSEWGRVYKPGSRVITMYGSAGLASSRTWETRRPRVVIATFYGASSELRVDGKYANVGNVGAPGTAPNQTVFGLAQANEPWHGWIGELLYYNRLLTTSELQRTESYLTRKWGIA